VTIRFFSGIYVAFGFAESGILAYLLCDRFACLTGDYTLTKGEASYEFFKGEVLVLPVPFSL
jgi:hypothetical protein